MSWKKELLEKYKHMISTNPRDPINMFGIEHGDGWRKILVSMFVTIDHLQKEHRAPAIQIVQIKEKFGTLNVYYDGGDHNVAEQVTSACHASYYTCELCGSTENVGRTTGWITVCCEKCWKTEERLKTRAWKTEDKGDGVKMKVIVPVGNQTKEQELTHWFMKRLMKIVKIKKQ